MRTLLEELEERRVSFVHVKRDAPWIKLARKGKDQTPQMAQLLDVGTDFIEVGMTLPALGKARSSQIISRDQIAEIVWLGESN